MPSIIGGKFKRSKIEVPSKLVRTLDAVREQKLQAES